jgi:hypothetical protein
LLVLQTSITLWSKLHLVLLL